MSAPKPHEAPGVEGHFAYVVRALRMGIGTHGAPCVDQPCQATAEFREAIDRAGHAKAATDELVKAAVGVLKRLGTHRQDFRNIDEDDLAAIRALRASVAKAVGQ